jgi:hypothetical protein
VREGEVWQKVELLTAKLQANMVEFITTAALSDVTRRLRQHYRYVRRRSDVSCDTASFSTLIKPPFGLQIHENTEAYNLDLTIGCERFPPYYLAPR